MNLNNLDFNKLAVFAQVVEAGNYQRASETLHVTPSAISQTITALEHSLGIPLFYRLGKRLVPTELGLKIQREFQSHHTAFTQTLTQIAGKQLRVTGRIQVGAYLEFAKFQLAPLLTDFQGKHSDVQIKLTFDTPSRLHRLLAAGKLDVCFSIYPERDSPLIQSQAVCHEELVLVAPTGMLKEKPTFDAVMAAPMIEYYLNHQPIRRWIALHYRKKPRHLPIRTFAATAEMVLSLVRSGMGIGIVPGYLLTETAGVSVIRPSHRRLMDHIWMLQLKSQPRSLAVDLFTREAHRRLNGN
ncbi:MAG: LysR family transcriptional regulator [Bacteriovoracia bacterium]